MWKIGVILILVVVIFDVVTGDVKYGPAQRIKRSPYYGCDPDYGPPHPRFFPPPPPPPFWPHPPPPPPFWPPPPPPPPPPQTVVVYEPQQQQQSQAISEAAATNQVQEQPCDSCGGQSQSSAISNAQSRTGDAVAIAIARAKNN